MEEEETLWLRQLGFVRKKADKPLREKSGFKKAFPIRGFHAPPPASAKLTAGRYVSSNPGVMTSNCYSCRKRYGRMVGRNRFYVAAQKPVLLVRHYTDQSLELWFCRGCPDRLIRVDRDAREVVL